jgi:hypothetical protein
VGVAAPARSGAAGYFAAVAQRAGVPGFELTQAAGVDTTGVDLAVVRADASAISRAAHADPAWHSALTTRQDHSVTVYRWLRDNQVDVNRGTGILDQLPGSRRVAVVAGRTLLTSRNDATPAATAANSSSATRLPRSPDVTTRTDTRLYGLAARAWDRLPLIHRIAWAAHTDTPPILEGAVIRPDVARLPSGVIPKPVWPWYSRTDQVVSDVDRLW